MLNINENKQEAPFQSKVFQLKWEFDGTWITNSIKPLLIFLMTQTSIIIQPCLFTGCLKINVSHHMGWILS
jgi:hypothetical protein